LAIILEDFAACTGVVVASAGILATNYSGLMAFDTLACFGVGGLLAGVGARLALFNRQYLIGVAVDDYIVHDIERILRNRASIYSVRDIQTQWVGPSAFMLKAECDFEGAYFSHLLEDIYDPLVRYDLNSADGDVWLTLSLFSEDVTRLIEIEVHDIEAQIRKKYPQAAFIHLEPDSKYSYLNALSGREVTSVFANEGRKKAWAESRLNKLVDAPTALRRRAKRMVDSLEYKLNDEKVIKLLSLADRLEMKKNRGESSVERT